MSFIKKLALEASAGSGKTFALSIRYVSLLFLGAKPHSILTLTFTNKASTQMSERISSLLKSLTKEEIDLRRSQEKDFPELKEIQKLTNLSEEDILKLQPSVLKNFLASSLNISTIDKFNTQILRSFSLYLSLMPDFQVGEGVDEHEELKSFIKEIKKRGYYQELIEFSVYEQKRVQDIFSYLKTLNQKSNELNHIDIKEYDISKIKPKVLKIFYDLREFFISCPKGLSKRAVNTFEIDEIEDILEKGWLKKDSFDYWDYKKCYDVKADELLRKLKDALKEYIRAKESYYKRKYFEIFSIYKEVKKRLTLKTNSLEFDDITNFVFELLRGGKIDSEFLYFRLDGKIDHILIDEFQDTSISQYKILEPLIEEVNSGVGVKEFKSFFYVGDTKQSIYRFRGGVKELFYYVKELFDVKVEQLNTNYRSTKRVVDFVNETFRDKIKGYFDQNSNSDKESGYVKVVESEELLELIVDQVEFLLENKVSEDDIAILTYANDDAFVIEEALLKRFPALNITTTTTVKLINIPTVRALIEFLKHLYFKERIYLANFLALIGEDIDKEVDISGFDYTKPLDELIKDIVATFEIFDSDENILKFIEVISNFSDIDEFIFNCEDIEEPSPIKKQTGIKILTIHKSKGLEFDHVLVVDRLKKKSNQNGHFIFDYDKVELKELYIRTKSRELFDDEYKEALEREKVLESEDELNALYVAFTRAKNSLIVCKKDKNSSFDILNLPLIERGEIIKSEDKKDLVTFDKFEYESKRYGFQDKESKSEDAKEDFAAINFGLALHYMLENLSDFSKKSLDDAFWITKNRYELLVDAKDLQRIKERVEKLLQDSDFLDLIDGTLYKEIALSYEGEIKQVDLLVQKEDHYIVIDYKSSDSVQNKHIKQVSYYKKALQDILNKSVKGYLCYVRDDGVEMVEV